MHRGDHSSLLGLAGFYVFVFLEPEWNWRWSIPAGSNFQKYIGAAVILGFLISGMRGNRFRGWLGLSVYSLMGFLGLAYVSSLQSINEAFSTYYLDIIGKVILVAIICIRVVNDPKKAWMLLWVMVVSQGYNAFRINEQYFLDGYSLYAFRDWGFKGDNNLYSIFTVPSIGGAFALAIHSTKNWQRALAGSILILQIHQLMLMQSRGTMIGAVFSAALGFLLMPKNRYTISCAAVAFAAGVVLAGPPVVKEFKSAFEPKENRDSSAESRFKLWDAGYRITLDNALIGVGPYAGQVMVPRYAPEFADLPAKGLHNLLFEISTGCGIPATVLYFGYFLVPWYVLSRFIF